VQSGLIDLITLHDVPCPCVYTIQYNTVVSINFSVLYLFIWFFLEFISD